MPLTHRKSLRLSEVPAALRNLESQKTFIRSNRDWLYRTVRAWQPLLLEWRGIGSVYDQRARAALEHTYHFLAPRFMPGDGMADRFAAREERQASGMA